VTTDNSGFYLKNFVGSLGWALFMIHQEQYDYFYNLYNDNTTAVLFVRFFEIGEL